MTAAGAGNEIITPKTGRIFAEAPRARLESAQSSCFTEAYQLPPKHSTIFRSQLMKQEGGASGPPTGSGPLQQIVLSL